MTQHRVTGHQPSDLSPRWTPRVRGRVTLAAATVTLVAAVLGAVLFVTGLHESLKQSLATSARQQADSVVAQLGAGQSVERASITGKDDLFVQIVDPRGITVASDHAALIEPVLTSAGTSDGVSVPGLEDSYVVVAVPADNGDLVVVGLSEEQVVQATHTSVLLLAIGVPTGVALVAGVVWLAIGRALRPVEVMRRQAAEISSERLHARLAVPPGDDEIPRLALTLNEMLDRIDRASQQQRQFVSDASHELRSPLATLRQMADTARRSPDRTTVARLAEDVLDEELRMEGLVKALLTLARLDGQPQGSGQSVDLDDTVLGEVARLRVAHPSLDIDQREVSAGEVVGDPVLLRQVVTNLLNNAARHARTRVAVSLGEHEGVVRLTVSDDGSGVAPADRERIFERFSRLDEARARDAGGAGLGLAIVHKVVTSAGGRVLVEESEWAGARFVLTLPAAPH